MSVLESSNLTKKRNTYSIAVVGGGSAAVAFVDSFVDCVVSQQLKDIQLTLFEKKDTIGSGYAYQEDLDCLRLNAPPEIMSVSAKNRTHFVEWLNDKEEYREMRKESEFIPRRVYGNYLTDTLYKAIEEAKNYMQCEILFKQVTDLHKRDDDQYEVITAEGQSFLFDFVLLTVGATESDDHYQLMGQPGYVHRPYPAQAFLKNIGKTDTVGIMGSRLTAVDLAIALRHSGHEGPMIMMSKHGRIPSIAAKRELVELYQTKFCTIDNLTHFLEKYHYISLRHIVRLMRREFKAAGLDWREALLDRGERHDDVESVKQNIAAASDKNHVASNNILFGTLLPILGIWKHVPQEHKQLLDQKYMSDFLQMMTSVPLINANQIYDLLLSEQLHILGGLDAIEKRGQTFHITLRDGSELSCDHLINATGPSKDISKNDLIKNLLTKGYAVENSNGGIQVDYDSGAVIDQTGKKQETFHAVGYIAYGTYLFINNLPMILPTAYKIAAECAGLASAKQTSSLS